MFQDTGHLNVRLLTYLEIGHKQELARHFSVFSLIGLASTCTISWTGMFGSIPCIRIVD